MNSYTLQPPPQKKLPPSPLAVRHNSPILNSPAVERHNIISSPVQSSPVVERKERSPLDDRREKTPSNRSSTDSESQFIRPLAQVGTLTTTDSEGRVRVIVPVPSGAEDAGELLRALRIDDFPRPNVPPIQRSTSEKVPNRSELMSQVQRTAWARHTTK